MGDMSNDGLVTVDTGGCVRMWETALAHLEKSMQKWRNLIGQGDDDKLQVRCEALVAVVVTQSEILFVLCLAEVL